MKIIKIFFVLILLAIAAYSGFIYGQFVLQKNFIEVEIPFKQEIGFPLKQDIAFPLNMEISVPINKTFYLNKRVDINTSVYLDTIIKVPVNISGFITMVDVPIKQSVPLNTFFEISEPIVISEQVSFPINETISIPVDRNVSIPVDTTIRTRVPLPWSK
jgi:hypothetical protein